MRSYSQNQEDLIVLALFKGFKGTLLEIGANDGQTLSNSKLLIENGWKAHLLEPGEICEELIRLHEKNDNVIVHNFGIGETNSEVTFYESDAHVPGGADRGLVSSVNYAETERWRKTGVNFRETTISLLSFGYFYASIGRAQIDFISIDAEGMDWEILNQIDLEAIGCKVLCIEYNGDQELFKKFTDYCKGFRLVDRNNENLIFSKI